MNDKRKAGMLQILLMAFVIGISQLAMPWSGAAANESSISNDQFTMYTDATNLNEALETAAPVSRQIDEETVRNLKVVPGGQSLGVQLQTVGVLVVGHHLVVTEDGKVSPGEDAQVKVGDAILQINDKKIDRMEDVKPLVEHAGEKGETLHLTLKRGKETIKTKLTPEKSEKEGVFQLGLYIRDSAAGIGTMTFYEPQSKKYGALGHIISDMDTKKPIEIDDGTIVRSSVTAIERGNSGSPGEKQAKFSIADHHLGNITKNSPFGIFGKLNDNLSNGKMNEALPIALSHEVKDGPAKILTVIKGEKVESFGVEIMSSIQQKAPATKGMVVKITDKRLLKETGGIVQGMSGSPIIQNGKVIGAVTHVFVNDPTSGYGVHIEWMLEDAGINLYKSHKKAS